MTAQGPLVLQVCEQCGTVQYPAREVCRNCLGGELTPGPVDGGGTVVSWCRLHASLEAEFRDRLPMLVASIRLTTGPVVLAHWTGSEPSAGEPAKVSMSSADPPVLFARNPGADSDD